MNLYTLSIIYKRQRETEGAIKTGQSRKTVNIRYTKRKTKTNKTKTRHTTFFVCIEHYHTQDTGRRQKTKTKQNKTNKKNKKQNKTKTQHNVCWTPLCANKHKYVIRV